MVLVSRKTAYNCLDQIVEVAMQTWEELGMIRRLDVEGGLKLLGPQQE